MEKLYLYGVIKTSSDINFGILDMKKESPDIIECISHDGLGIICSKMDLEEDEELQATRKNLLNHQKAIERVMEEHTVLPFSFGILTNGKKELRQIIDDKKDFFTEKLQKIEGKIELNLKGIWDDMGKIYQHITQTNEEVSALKS